MLLIRLRLCSFYENVTLINNSINLMYYLAKIGLDFMQVITRKFNVNEYHKMEETGILTPEDRVELIRGEIIAMSPIGRKQAAAVNRLNYILYEK